VADERIKLMTKKTSHSISLLQKTRQAALIALRDIYDSAIAPNAASRYLSRR